MPAPKDTPKRISEALKDDKGKRMGDTLDFYNDSMPRRAVEGLFDKADKPKPAARLHEETDTTPPKRSFDDLEENIALYASKKTKEARRNAFLEEEPEETADNIRRNNNIRIEPEYIDEDIGGYARFMRFIQNIDVENLPVVKMAVGAVIIIIIIIMTALVFRINSKNAQLAEANEKLAKVEDESADYQRTLIENDGLREQISELEAEIERITTLLTNMPAVSQAPETPSSPPSQTATESPVAITEATTYTVQRGDTLSSIASRFYGNSGEYQKIMDANNMTNTVIHPGQTLRIPPK